MRSRSRADCLATERQRLAFPRLLPCVPATRRPTLFPYVVTKMDFLLLVQNLYLPCPQRRDFQCLDYLHKRQ
jgi:hypothetical protein